LQKRPGSLDHALFQAKVKNERLGQIRRWHPRHPQSRKQAGNLFVLGWIAALPKNLNFEKLPGRIYVSTYAGALGSAGRFEMCLHQSFANVCLRGLGIGHECSAGTPTDQAWCGDGHRIQIEPKRIRPRAVGKLLCARLVDNDRPGAGEIEHQTASFEQMRERVPHNECAVHGIGNTACGDMRIKENLDFRLLRELR
jgi:hypothetical protein